MLKANLFYTTTYEGAELDKLNRSLNLIEATINGDKFKTAVIRFRSFEFTRYKCFLAAKVRTIKLTAYTNEELYKTLLNGHRQEGSDSFMDLKLQISKAGGGSAIGETSADNVITTYRAAFNRMSEAALAAHITHEWTHTMGFQHSYSNRCDSNRDCLSVPYAIGNIVEIILTGKCWYGCKYETLNK
jgi:hypothetical protein